MPLGFLLYLSRTDVFVAVLGPWADHREAFLVVNDYLSS
jgi:hypothetical protein